MPLFSTSNAINAILCAVFALIFCACSGNQPQYVDSREYMSFEIDNHEIDGIIEKQAKSLLNHAVVKEQKEPKILTIGAIENETDSLIDIETIANELAKHLSKSGKFVIVSAGRDKKAEQILKDSRKMRDNKEYNQYTTIEEGNLIAPHYALVGKITQRNRRVGDDEVREYTFTFRFYDLALGVARWIETERITKKLPKSEIRNFTATKSNSNESAYDSNEDSSDFSVDSERKNHFVMGADFGIMNFGDIKLEQIPINIGGRAYIIRPNTSKSSSSSFSESTISTYPLSVRLGYLRDIGNWGIGINALYSYAFSKIENKHWDTNNYYYGANLNIDGSASMQRVGGEILAFYQPFSEKASSFNMFVGASVLKDFGSKIKIKVNATNQNRVDTQTIERKIDGLYAMVKLGLIWYFSKYVGFTYELNYSWAINGENAINTGFGWAVLGLQMRI